MCTALFNAVKCMLLSSSAVQCIQCIQCSTVNNALARKGSALYLHLDPSECVLECSIIFNMQCSALQRYHYVVQYTMSTMYTIQYSIQCTGTGKGSALYLHLDPSATADFSYPHCSTLETIISHITVMMIIRMMMMMMMILINLDQYRIYSDG